MMGAELTVSPVHVAAYGTAHPDRGLSLRFPRFLRVRPDKPPTEATTSQQLRHMYSKQARRIGTVGAADAEDSA